MKVSEIRLQTTRPLKNSKLCFPKTLLLEIFGHPIYCITVYICFILCNINICVSAVSGQ